MNRRKGEKYDAIIEAAIAVFAKQGYHGAQMARIAQEAGIAAGTIYLYFTSKQELLVSVFAEKIGHLIEETAVELSTLESPKEQLGGLITKHLQVLASYPDLAVVTQIELRQADPWIRARISEIMRGYFELIERIIIRGQERGDFIRDLDYRLVRNMIFGTLDQTVTAWVISGQKYSLIQLAGPIYRLISRGIEER